MNIYLSPVSLSLSLFSLCLFFCHRLYAIFISPASLPVSSRSLSLTNGSGSTRWVLAASSNISIVKVHSLFGLTVKDQLSNAMRGHMIVLLSSVHRVATWLLLFCSTVDVILRDSAINLLPLYYVNIDLH